MFDWLNRKKIKKLQDENFELRRKNSDLRARQLKDLIAMGDGVHKIDVLKNQLATYDEIVNNMSEDCFCCLSGHTFSNP